METKDRAESFAESVIKGTSYLEVCQLFSDIAHDTALHPPLPVSGRRWINPEGMEERLREAKRFIMAGLQSWFSSSTGNEQSMEVRRNATLIELVRRAYEKEMVESCLLPTEYWTEQKNELVRLCVNSGVKVQASSIAEFETAVAQFLLNPPKLPPYDGKKEPPRRDSRALYEIYVQQAALTGATMPSNPGLISHASTVYQLLAIASRQVNPKQLVLLENALTSHLAIIRAGMVLPKQILQEFAQKVSMASQCLMDGMGSIIVHHSDTAKTTEIDEAVKDIISKEGNTLDARIKRWDPEAQ